MLHDLTWGCKSLCVILWSHGEISDLEVNRQPWGGIGIYPCSSVWWFCFLYTKCSFCKVLTVDIIYAIVHFGQFPISCCFIMLRPEHGLLNTPYGKAEIWTLLMEGVTVKMSSRSLSESEMKKIRKILNRTELGVRIQTHIVCLFVFSELIFATLVEIPIKSQFAPWRMWNILVLNTVPRDDWR